jgi:hypothetical protein
MGFLPFFYTRNSYITAQKNIIGILYEKEPEVCEELVPFLLEGDTFVKDSGKGTQALISMGYTSAGGDYLYEATGWQKCYLGVCLAQVVLAGGLICILLHFQRQRKQGEDAIREAKKHIEEGRAREAYLEDKNSRTQAFIENIAHQIKTPLSCISISLDLILEEANDGEKEQILPCFVYLNQIKTLMKRLLDIAGLEAGKILMHRERISLGSLLEECRAEFPDGAKRIFISMAGEQERTGEYYGDPEWLKENRGGHKDHHSRSWKGNFRGRSSPYLRPLLSRGRGETFPYRYRVESGKADHRETFRNDQSGQL